MLINGLVFSESRIAYEYELIEDLSDFDLKYSNGVFKSCSVLFRKDNICYTNDRDIHHLIIGDTGSMKTLKFVLHLIYSCAMANESMVIVDPKGNLFGSMEHFWKREVIKNYLKLKKNSRIY